MAWWVYYRIEGMTGPEAGGEFRSGPYEFTECLYQRDDIRGFDGVHNTHMEEIPDESPTAADGPAGD